MTRVSILLAALLLSSIPLVGQTNEAKLHVPGQGTAERKAILDALRTDPQTSFKVHYIKVHNGWCWDDPTPLDIHGKATAEGGPNLLHLEEGNWKVMDLSKVPEDPNDPLGAEDASAGFVRNLVKTLPEVPRDIFPKPSH